MRRFMVHLVTEVEFEDGDEASDKTVQNYQKHLKDTVQNAARPGNLAPVNQGRPIPRARRMTMKKQFGPPMTLMNMRANGVRMVTATCEAAVTQLTSTSTRCRRR